MFSVSVILACRWPLWSSLEDQMKESPFKPVGHAPLFEGMLCPYVFYESHFFVVVVSSFNKNPIAYKIKVLYLVVLL